MRKNTWDAALISSYLRDAGCDDKETQATIKKMKEGATWEDLPDSLWKGQLLEKGRYYYYSGLNLTSPQRLKHKDKVFYDFYIEPTIKFSINGLYNYFCRTCKYEFPNNEVEKNKMNLLSHVKRFDTMEDINGLDFVLTLIDLIAENNEYCMSTNSLVRNEEYLYQVRDILLDKINYAWTSTGVQREPKYKYRTFLIDGENVIYAEDWSEKTN